MYSSFEAARHIEKIIKRTCAIKQYKIIKSIFSLKNTSVRTETVYADDDYLT